MRLTALAPALLVLLLTGCSVPVAAAPSAAPEPTSTENAPQTRSVFGKVDAAITDFQYDAHLDKTINGDPKDPNWLDRSCVSDQYTDVNAGAKISITDAAGVVIGVGELEAGELAATSGRYGCVFPFTVEDVLLADDFYGIEVGNAIRGDIKMTLREMQIGPYLVIG